MAEAAEERDKENFLSGWSDGRNVSEADRESPATREATEKKITAAAGSGRAGCREISEKYREPPSTSATSDFPVWKDACCRSRLARPGRGCIFFRRKSLQKKNIAAAESAGGRVQRQAETFDSQNSIATQAQS